MTKQNISDSENIVQIAGNATVNNYGLAVHEVRELALLFLKENFPQLRAEAMAAADNNVKNFIKTFEENLSKTIAGIDATKFKDPDIQSSLNDAVLAAAKKGEKSNQDILVELVLERVSTKTDDFVSLVAAEAIKVAPRLTKEQICFLSLVLFHHNFKVTNAISLDQINSYAQLILDIVKPVLNGFSESNKMHLEYAGCVSINRVTGNSPYTLWKNNNDFLKEISEQDIQSQIEHSCPALGLLAKAYIDNNIGQINLTSVGIIIALANFPKSLGKLQYSNWLN